MRVGIGYDIHPLKKGRKLFLGGVRIPYKKGLFGHSDADVLLHAVCDAILGAAGLGDIGEHFPDSDDRFKDVSGLKVLGVVYQIIKKRGFSIANIDAIIFMKAPKITPYKDKMKQAICAALKINKSAVNIKAKTMNGLESVGQAKAIAASCVVLLDSKKF